MNNQITRSSDIPSRRPFFRVRKLFLYGFSVVQVLLVLRLSLKLFGANPTESITNMIYSTTSFIVYPFTAVFGLSTSGGSDLEWTTLLAIIFYWVLVITINKLLTLGRPPLSKIEQARVLSIEKYSH